MIWITVSDCISLPDMPTTRAGVLLRAKSENWTARKRNKGKGLEYSILNLPLDAQLEVKQKQYSEILSKDNININNQKTRAKNIKGLEIVRQCPAILETKTTKLNENQRCIADARCALVQEVLKLESEANLSRIKAVTYISEQSKLETLPKHLQQSAEIANAKKGNRLGVGIRMLNQWVVDYLKAKDSTERLFLLAPGKYQEQKPENISWFPVLI